MGTDARQALADIERALAGAHPDIRRAWLEQNIHNVEILRAAAYEQARAETLAAGHETIDGLAPWIPLPHQTPPPGPWRGWMLMGGRGSGKSAGATRYFVEHIWGPPCDTSVPGGHQCVIGAPTLDDAVRSVFHGPSGIRRHDPTARVLTTLGGTVVRFRNGVEVPLIGLDTAKGADRFRAAGNRCMVMLEEAAAIPALSEAWDNLDLGLRLGPNPRVIMSTTPKPRKILSDIVNDPDVVLTSGTIHDNPHLDAAFKDRMQRRFAGTRKEAQELLGILVDEVVGAMWSLDGLAKPGVRLSERDPDRLLTIVGVDPSGSTGPDADETGIVVVDASIDANGHPHVAAVADYTQPDGDAARWSRAAVQAALDWDAGWIIGEVNYGGDMVIHTVRTALRDMGVELDRDLELDITVDKVTATRGKKRRAEPIAVMFDPTPPRGHLLGHLPELENQMCTFIDEPGADSPDRLDAFVWAATYALQSSSLGVASVGSQESVFGRR